MRLDQYLVENSFAESRNKAHRMIVEGAISVDGRVITKPSFDINANVVEITGQVLKYVSRGGLKLEAALQAFDIDPTNAKCVDIGSSTGGFTDCLLKKGAREVYCIDSGSDQLHASLRNDERVHVLENFNAKNLCEEHINGCADICVMDVSFISQVMLYPAVCRVLRNGGVYISLIKPQFEAGKEAVGKNGIVKKRSDHLKVLDGIRSSSYAAGLCLSGVILSPVTGGDGNYEYLALFKKSSDLCRDIDFRIIIPEGLK